jgi:hypothetical protein
MGDDSKIPVGPSDFYLYGSIYGVYVLETPKGDGGRETPQWTVALCCNQPARSRQQPHLINGDTLVVSCNTGVTRVICGTSVSSSYALA